ncbi:glycosyltransferase [Teichococcus coralli]|nr:glycosyltransferase [Pseudoroseomonas coralli]
MNALRPPSLPFPPALGSLAAVAIPVRNEAERIGACLDALAAQREAGPFAVLLLLNGCTDTTEAVVRARAAALPFRLVLRRARLPATYAHAGEARARAMEAAAALLERGGCGEGLLLTTDADSRVAPDWLAATRAEISAGAEAVAGWVEHEPQEAARLPPALAGRIALENAYEALLAELEARLDPLPGDLWPRHRMSSGASLAVRLSTFRRVGGLPRVPAGEDRAFCAALAAADIRLRHSLAVRVRTACRTEGRATGGAADTLRRQLAEPGLACDPMLEPAGLARRRWQVRAALRRHHAAGDALGLLAMARHLRLHWREAESWLGRPFGSLWEAAERESLLLMRRPLHPAQLPEEIAHARALLAEMVRPGAADPAGSVPCVPAAPPEALESWP